VKKLLCMALAIAAAMLLGIPTMSVLEEEEIVIEASPALEGEALEGVSSLVSRGRFS